MGRKEKTFYFTLKLETVYSACCGLFCVNDYDPPLLCNITQTMLLSVFTCLLNSLSLSLSPFYLSHFLSTSHSLSHLSFSYLLSLFLVSIILYLCSYSILFNNFYVHQHLIINSNLLYTSLI